MPRPAIIEHFAPVGRCGEPCADSRQRSERFPPDSQEPRLWADHERPIRDGREPIEIVRPDLPSRVPEPVGEDVVHSACDFARRLEDVTVVPLRKERPAPPDGPVHPTRDPHLEALHPARERHSVLGLRNQMDVVPLHEAVHDAEPNRSFPS